MQIAIPTAEEHADYRALVDAEIRPGRANSQAWEDFPLILHDDNRPWTLVARSAGGEITAGISCLIRDFKTNWGLVPIAGIGSVVTRPDARGQGLSRALQDELLARLRRQKVPLGVLWTDKPEYYAGRGFEAAGWEFHLGFAAAGLPGELPAGVQIRELTAADVPAAEQLFLRHRWRTERLPGDSLALYLMPGTTSLVAVATGGTVLATAFCGKGADFPGYVHEWSGPLDLVLALLEAARRRGLADKVLVPAGAESLAERLVPLGASWEVRPAGFWKVLVPEHLAALVRRPGLPAAATRARTWLGGVDEAGHPQPGPLTVAVWGFDSV